jgi:hypothetical protein
MMDPHHGTEAGYPRCSHELFIRTTTEQQPRQPAILPHPGQITSRSARLFAPLHRDLFIDQVKTRRIHRDLRILAWHCPIPAEA